MSSEDSGMFKLVLVLILLVIGGVAAGCSTTRVSVGHVGVKVRLSGSARGVQDMQLKTGWVMYNPLTEDIVEFPVNVQNIVLSASPNEGQSKEEKSKNDTSHAGDESITFSSVEGVNVGADVGCSFHIDPNMAPQLYARFKQTDMRELGYGYMRNIIREAFGDVASKMQVQEIYGAGKTKLIADVNQKVKIIFEKDGIIIDQLTVNGALRLPENVASSINNAIAATQNAIQSENKVRQVKAEAEQAVAAANGAADAVRQKAKGDADALLIKTKAEADSKVITAEADATANKKINSTLTPAVLRYKSLYYWDGKLPTYMGSGATPMLNLN